MTLGFWIIITSLAKSPTKKGYTGAFLSRNVDRVEIVREIDARGRGEGGGA